MNDDDRYVVYTAKFGDAFPVPSLAAVDPRIRYVCFSDTPVASPPWEWQYAPRWFADTKLTVGYLRCLPHLWFGGHTRVVWIDPVLRSVNITRTDIDRWLATRPVAAVNHGTRKSAREEADVVVSMGLERRDKIEAVKRRWKDIGFPDRQGLAATMLVAFDTCDPKVQDMCWLWWLGNLECRRGQVVFTPALWEAGLDWTRIGVDWTRPNRHFDRPLEPPTTKGRSAPKDDDCALSTAGLPSGVAYTPKYVHERWWPEGMRANQEINARYVRMGGRFPPSTCYPSGALITELTPPDLRLACARLALCARSGTPVFVPDNEYDSNVVREFAWNLLDKPRACGV